MVVACSHSACWFQTAFFCIHAGGGNVLMYRDLARRLGPDQPFYGLQAQGLDGKQPRHKRIEDMAAHYIKEIQTLEPKGPYFLGGSSFGGAVAFEMARQLDAQGQKVALVALFDTAGPVIPNYYRGPHDFIIRSIALAAESNITWGAF